MVDAKCLPSRLASSKQRESEEQPLSRRSQL
jgi:hypothetical protein